MTNNRPRGIFDMTPANAIIAPLSMLQSLDLATTDAILILIRHFDSELSDSDRASIDRALDNPDFNPSNAARIRHELYRKFR